MGEECDFTHGALSSDEGDFLSSEKLFPVISWVEPSCEGLKLVSSVSKCPVHPLSSRDRWEEVSKGGDLDCNMGVLIDDTAGYDLWGESGHTNLEESGSFARGHSQ